MSSSKSIKRSILLAWYGFAEKFFRVTIAGRTWGFRRYEDWEKRYNVEED